MAGLNFLSYFCIESVIPTVKEKNATSKNRLLIQIDAEGFSLSVYNKPDQLLSSKRTDCDVFKLSQDELFSLLQAESEINSGFVELVIESYQYCIIPDDIFRLEEATDLLLFEHKPAPADSILYNKIPEFGLVIVFAIPGSVFEVLSSLFPASAIENHVSSFISNHLSLREHDSVFCRTGKTKLDAVAVKDSRITLINSFDYKTPEDYLYFVLNMYEKLGLNQQKHPLYLLSSPDNMKMEQMLLNYLKVTKL